MKCPVCDKVNKSMLCPNCGFDSSKDYGRYPTLAPVGKRPAASGLREQWKTPQEPKESPKSSEPEAGESAPVIQNLPAGPRIKRKLLYMLIAAVVALVLGVGIYGGMENSMQMGTNLSEPWRSNVLRCEKIQYKEQLSNHEMMFSDDEAESYSVFNSHYHREQIKTVTFLDSLTEMTADSWDVSESGNGSVMAWVKPNGEFYDLYIGADGGVCAGKSCRDLFAGYANMTNITFGNAFHTSGTKDMQAMFAGCIRLQDINLGDFDTSRVQQMGHMFYRCMELKKLDLSSFDTSRVRDMSWMFGDCYAMADLHLGDRFVVGKADTSLMFYNCPAGDEFDYLFN